MSLPERKTRIRSLAVAAVLFLTAVATVPAAAAEARTPPALTLPALTCTAHTLSVAIADPGPADQTLWGELCYRGRVEPRAVQLLVHGATYNHDYWDGPGSGYYSYVDAATLAGYATFNVDRIGAGASSHPPSSEVSVAAGAVALHDAISALRSGGIDGHRFTRVIWVGHSFGSLHAWDEIPRYHDVDAAILTGALHSLNPILLQNAASGFVPAAADPRFASLNLDRGYVTTVPGTRESFFYDAATTSPKVLAWDEATKDAFTETQFGDLGTLYGTRPDAAASQGITVPVLLVVGQFDNIMCLSVTQYDCSSPTSVRKYEEQFYPARTDLRVAVIPQTGHDLALSTTAPLTDAVMLGWALSRVPTR